jgi:hypothetical protein
MKRAHLLLGRNGDLLNLLPVLKQEGEALGEPVPLIVSGPYAPLLEGCSYIEPHIFPGEFDRAGEALRWAQDVLPDHQIQVSSPYAVDLYAKRVGWSFDRSIWISSGSPASPHSLPLVFDRRDPAREKELLSRLPLDPAKRLVLVSLSGFSSPFPDEERFFQTLRGAVPDDVQLLNLSNIRCERLYDLIALMERAHAMVAADSAPLHLSRAVIPILPVAAFLSAHSHRWHQTGWKPHHVLRADYSDAFSQVPKIASFLQKGFSWPCLHHVTSYGSTPSEETVRRMDNAKRSWNEEQVLSGGRWERVTFRPRRTASSLGEVPLPFIRDMFECVPDAPDDDIIVVTNADIHFTPGLTGQILDRCARFGCCFAHRWDFSKITRLAYNEHEVFIKGRFYPGSDLFACTPAWWRKHGSVFPDMVLGREAWDLILRNAMKRSVPPSQRKRIELKCAIYHEWHQSPWEMNRGLAGNVHNRTLASRWLSKFGGSASDYLLDPSRLVYHS